MIASLNPLLQTGIKSPHCISLETCANTTGKAIGLLQATTDSRVSIAIDKMRAKIDDNTSNISILFAEYMEPCTQAMEDPQGRIAYWMAK